ncbi:MAG TPA: beta-propeller domain-containing protein [Actinomycetota bacterium]|nr:beta-propeller domain-containing protein [Actinomycetota bacterium]
MSDRKDLWSGVDQPMDVPGEVKARIVDRITSSVASAEDGFTLLDNLDVPRPIPSKIATKLTDTVIGQGRSGRGGLYAAISAAAVITLIASTTLIARDRLGDTTPSLGKPSGDVALVAFASENEFREYMSSRSVDGVSVGGPAYSAGGDVALTSEPMPMPMEAQAKEAQSLPQRVAEGLKDMAGSRSVGRSNPSTVTENAPVPPDADEDADFSKTNVQEKGVDEPDLVKTDGKIMVAISAGKLWVLDVTGATPVMKGSMPFPGQASTQTSRSGSGIASDMSIMPVGPDDGQMFLEGTRVIHIAQVYGMRADTKVTTVSIEDPSSPKITSETTLEGSLVGARMSDGIVRLVLRSNPSPELRIQDQPTHDDAQRTVEENRKIIEEAKPEDWLPEFELEKPGVAPIEGKIHSWKEVQRPQEFSGVSMLSIVTLDPANPSPKNSVSIVGAGDIVYSSTENLYVSTQKYVGNIVLVPRGERIQELPPGVEAMRAEDYRPATQIHKFSLSQPGPAVYRASGEVEGMVLNQFSMSEKDGFLRVATTRPQVTQETRSESFVTVMQEKGDKLVGIGAVGNLGKGEQIFAVRFIGNLGYVVTFRQTDPLYVIDLTDPTRPSIRGELKIPGFSNYLHPVGDHLLLGVGQDADDQGRVKGLQVSLFDVSDPSAPKRLHQKTLGNRGSSSQAQFDHHAFLYWPPTSLLVIPLTTYSETGGQGFSGALALEVSETKGFSEATEISHTSKVAAPSDSTPERMMYPIQMGPQILRSLVIRQGLITYSSAGLQSNELKGLRERSWVPFTDR